MPTATRSSSWSSWRRVRAVRSTRFPDTVEALVTTRLDAFSPADRVLVQEASVFGMDIDLALLGAVLGRGRREVSRWERLAPWSARWHRGSSASDTTSSARPSTKASRSAAAVSSTSASGTCSRPGSTLEEQSALLATHYHLAEAHTTRLEIPGGGGTARRPALRQRRGLDVFRPGDGPCRAPHGAARAGARRRVAESLGDICERSGDHDRAPRRLRRGPRPRTGGPPHPGAPLAQGRDPQRAPEQVLVGPAPLRPGPPAAGRCGHFGRLRAGRDRGGLRRRPLPAGQVQGVHGVGHAGTRGGGSLGPPLRPGPRTAAPRPVRDLH